MIKLEIESHPQGIRKENNVMFVGVICDSEEERAYLYLSTTHLSLISIGRIRSHNLKTTIYKATEVFG